MFLRRTLFALALVCLVDVACAQPQDATLKLRDGANHLVAAGLYRVGFQMFGQELKWLPVGWSGHFAMPEGISYQAWSPQGGRQTLLVHPPWRLGTGDTVVEYDLALPNTKPIEFTIGIAMAASGTEKSDGVTFRAKLWVKGATGGTPVPPAGGTPVPPAGGTPVPPTGGTPVPPGVVLIFDENRKSTEWKDFRFDLSPYAGKTVTLRLETDPGPAKDPSFDFAVFGDPTVTVGVGSPDAELKQLVAGAKSSDADVRGYANDNTVGIRPTTPPGYQNSVRKQGNVFIFESRSGADKVTYRWDVSQPYLDGLQADFRTDSFRPCWGSGPSVTGDDNLQRSLTEARLDGSKATMTEKYVGKKGPFTVTVTAAIQGNSLLIDTTSPDPTIALLRYGGFSRVAWRRMISAPYLTFGDMMYLQDSRGFVSFVPDWTVSQASWMESRLAHYDPLTDGRLNKLVERACLTVAPHFVGVLPNLPNPSSPFVKELSDRVIADLWGGTFAENATWLPELASYGMERLAVFNHSWQRGGYDNEYPTVMPANKGLGGDEALKAYSAKAKSLGYLWGLHENYVDFYPNSEAWNPDDVSLAPDGKMIPAWKNIVQSYAYKPTAIVRYGQKYGQMIHDAYGTTDCFLDVHSAVPPWFHDDFRASEPGAGSFRPVWDAHIGLWKAERAIHGGPVFGEGANHFFWSGYLDGTEAQIGGGESQPLGLDFDLLKIHPLQLNHGMGYMERWLTTGYGGDWTRNAGTTPKRDRYRAMEVAYAHAGYLASQNWRLLPHAVREYYLVRPLMRRYATANVERIEYELGGKLVSADVAAVIGGAQRAHIRYDNGLELWSNIGDTDWQVGDSVIPPNGYLATGPSVTSGTTIRNGIVSDYSEADGIIFADGRSHDEHADFVARPAAAVSLASADVTGPRSFRVTYKFEVKRAIKGDRVAFVHFTNPASDRPDNIVFQQDHQPKVPTSQWKPGDVILDGPYDITVPAGQTPGEYKLMIGLWSADGRVDLVGNDDGGQRYWLATLNLKADGFTIDMAPPAKPTALPTPESLRVNAKATPVDFGKIVTCGAVALKLGAGSAELISIPHEDQFAVSLRCRKIDKNWRPGATRCEALDRDGKRLGDVPVKVDGDTITIQVGKEGAAKYRLVY